MGLIKSVEGLKRKKSRGSPSRREFCLQTAFRPKLQHQFFPITTIARYQHLFHKTVGKGTKTTLATYRGNKYALEYLCQSFIYNCLNPMNPLSTLLPNTKKKKRCLFHHKGFECKSRKSRDTLFYLGFEFQFHTHTHTHTPTPPHPLCYLFGQN